MTFSSLSRRRGQRGQATTELLLCSWVILLFMAAAIQLFRVDRAVFKSITAAHATHFEEAFDHNCYENKPECTYDGGAVNTRVEWDPLPMPSVRIPTLAFFESAIGPFTMIESNNPKNWDYKDKESPCPTFSRCKRTKMAAGTYEPMCNSFEGIVEVAFGDPESTSGFCSAINSVLSIFDGL